MSNIKIHTKDYYLKNQPLALLALLNTLQDHSSLVNKNEIGRTHLFYLNDWFILLMVARRLKDSLGKKDRYEISIDYTSFLVFLRIYFDTLASVIHLLFKTRYSSNSRKFPKATSFEEQLKWFENNNDRELQDFKNILTKHSFDRFFRNTRELRNKLKEPPTRIKSLRMWNHLRSMTDDYEEIKREVGIALYKTITLSDFLGEYFFDKLNEVKPLKRKNKTPSGYPAAYRHKGEIEIYKWFNS